MLFARWRARRANRVKIEDIHGEIVAVARDVALYRDFDVPDDLDGRFEAIALYGGLVLRRLNQFGSVGQDLAQDVVDRLFEGFEDAVREMAIGDAGVRKRMKAMAAAFFGRTQAYHAALDAADRPALTAALSRNLYRSPDAIAPKAAALADRIFAAAAALDGLALSAFTQTRFRYPQGETP
jgi:cytochrome b pre-mRNA-processing protein 3